MLALPFLLGICLPSLWSPPFPPHALALISLSLVKVWLSPFMMWHSGLTALFLFLLSRAAQAYLPTALSVALRPLFPFVRPSLFKFFLLKPAPFYKLVAGFGSTNKSVTSLLLLSDSRSVLSSIFLFTSSSLEDLAGTVLCLLLFYQATMSPQTLVSSGKLHG